MDSLKVNGKLDTVPVYLREVEMFFDEFIFYDYGFVSVYEYDTDELIVRDYFEGSSAIYKNIARVFPKVTLKPSTKYYILIDGNMIKDSFDNYFEGVADKDAITFTTQKKESAPPIPSPYVQPRPVNIGNRFTLKFNENVYENYGNIYIYEKESNEVVDQIPVNSFNVYIDNSYYDFVSTELSFSPRVKLKTESDYYIKVDSGIVKDYFGNLSQGISDSSEWKFTTKSIDTSDLKIKYHNPEQSTYTLLPELSFTFKNSRRLRKGKGYLYIKRKDNDTIVSKINVIEPQVSFPYFAPHEVNIQLSEPLSPNTAYYVHIDSGFVYDANSGVSYKGNLNDITYSFKTSQLDELSLDFFLQSEPKTLTYIIFNRPPNLKSGSINIYDFNDSLHYKNSFNNLQRIYYNSTYAIYYLEKPLDIGKYYITLDSAAYSDPLTGKNNDPITKEMFGTHYVSTYDHRLPEYTSPLRISYCSFYEKDVVGYNDYFTINFNRPILHGETNRYIKIFRKDDNKLISVISNSENNYKALGQDLIANSTIGSLPPDTEYYIQIDSGFVVDKLTGQPYQGIHDRLHTFRTEPIHANLNNIGFGTENVTLAEGKDTTINIILKTPLDTPSEIKIGIHGIANGNENDLLINNTNSKSHIITIPANTDEIPININTVLDSIKESSEEIMLTVSLNNNFFTGDKRILKLKITDVNASSPPNEEATILTNKSNLPTSFLVYPNPTTSQFQIKSSLPNQSFTYEIYNQANEKLFEGNGLGSITFKKDLPSGMYILKIHSNKELIVRRILVM